MVATNQSTLPTIQPSNDPTIKGEPFERSGELSINELGGATLTRLSRSTLLGSLDRWDRWALTCSSSRNTSHTSQSLQFLSAQRPTRMSRNTRWRQIPP